MDRMFQDKHLEQEDKCDVMWRNCSLIQRGQDCPLGTHIANCTHCCRNICFLHSMYQCIIYVKHFCTLYSALVPNISVVYLHQLCSSKILLQIYNMQQKTYNVVKTLHTQHRFHQKIQNRAILLGANCKDIVGFP